jgi:O-antigen ligase
MVTAERQVLPGTDVEAGERGERGMRVMLAALIGLLVVVDLFDVKLGMGPGLSLENALLYVIALGLVLKIAVQQVFVLHLRALHMCFAVLILFSIFSYLTAAFGVAYPRYDVVKYGIALKSRLIDYATYFLVFFYGLRESRNAHAISRVLLLAVAFASTMALLSAFGIVQIGAIGTNDKDRLEGLMGEPNQDAAFLCLFIPCIVAAMMTSRGLWRLIWFGSLVALLGSFLLTASRGGLVGLALASVLGAFVFRRYIPFSRLVSFAGWAVGILSVLLVALSVRYGHVLYKRIIEDSTYTDVASASSGRFEMWTNALAMMADKPLTLLTGFGWEVYWLMPFRYAPHNNYLGLYFNLGVVGVLSWIMLMVLLVREVKKSLPFAEPGHRPLLIAFGFGVMGISIATFFVDLYAAWLWFWAYAGLVMRIAVNSTTKSSPRAIAAVATPAPDSGRDAFGWVGSAHR